ncbi:MAG: hypothetical protein AB7S38_15895 [Vulcanimicrobiota bacterium]
MSLEGFLEQARLAGQTHSAGQFTVDVERALQKLQAYQLPGPGHYLAKLFQAATLWQARKFEVRIGLLRTVAEFACNYDDSMNVVRLAEAMTGRGHWVAPAARHLGLAVRGALGPSGWVQWQVGSQSLQIGAGRVQVHQPAQPTAEPVCARFVLARGGLLAGLASSEERADEHAVASEMGRYASVAVSLDGRSTERGFAYPPKVGAAWYQDDSIRYHLMEGFLAAHAGLPDYHGPAPTLGQFQAEGGGIHRSRQVTWEDQAILVGGWLTTPLFLYADPALQYGTGYGARFCLPLELRGPARLTLMLDGAPARPKQVELGCPGLQCVASGQGLAIDLSEFQVIEDAAYEARLKSIRAAARQFLEQVNSRADRYLPAYTGYRAGKLDRFQAHLRSKLPASNGS